MSIQRFRPVDALRELEAFYAPQALAENGSFEAFASLGCEGGRIGDLQSLVGIGRALIGERPFAGGGAGLRLKLSAKPGKPVVLEAALAAAPEEALARIAPMVAELGGAVVAQDTLDGVTVRVSLPLAEAEEEEPPAESAATPEEGDLSGLRFLIADDSPTNRLVLEEMLAGTGAEIQSVKDGQEALDAWRAGVFDMLLFDISMPVMDGVTALRAIRAEEPGRNPGPAVPAVAVTANALVNQVADYLEAGFDAHLAKPFRRTELMHAIQTLRR